MNAMRKAVDNNFSEQVGKVFQDSIITEIFVEYDGPLVYTCETRQNGRFFVYNCEDNYWLYFPINEALLGGLLLNEIIKHFFMNSPFVFLVSTKGNAIEAKKMFTNEIPEKYIPKLF